MIISISGKKRHGKDTVAEMLAKLARGRGVQYVGHRFASLLDEIHKSVTGEEYQFLHGVKKEIARAHIIPLAEKLVEVYGEDVFVKKQFAKIEAYEKSKGGFSKKAYVFTDTRLKRELIPLKEKGAITVKVVRFQPGDTVLYDNGITIKEDKIVKCGSIAALLHSGVTAGYCEIQHPSIGHFTETELDNESFDHIIYNVGDLDDLREKVIELFIPIIKKYIQYDEKINI